MYALRSYYYYYGAIIVITELLLLNGVGIAAAQQPQRERPTAILHVEPGARAVPGEFRSTECFVRGRIRHQAGGQHHDHVGARLARRQPVGPGGIGGLVP